MSTEINAFERAESIQAAAHDHLKGIPLTKIAQNHGVSVETIKKWLEEYDDWIAQKVSDNSNVLDQHIENLVKFEEELKLLSTEAWDLADLATQHGAMSTKVQALRLAKDLAELKARAFQLMTPKMEKGYGQRMKRLERINSVLSSVIIEVISGCDRCQALADRKLQELERLLPDGSFSVVEGQIVEEENTPNELPAGAPPV